MVGSATDVADQTSVCALIAHSLAAVDAGGAPRAVARTWDQVEGLGSCPWLIAGFSVGAVGVVCSDTLE